MFRDMKTLERLTREHWEARPDTIEWETLKRYEPDQAVLAYEQMRAAVRHLSIHLCSPSDRLWLTRVSQEEALSL